MRLNGAPQHSIVLGDSRIHRLGMLLPKLRAALYIGKRKVTVPVGRSGTARLLYDSEKQSNCLPMSGSHPDPQRSASSGIVLAWIAGPSPHAGSKVIMIARLGKVTTHQARTTKSHVIADTPRSVPTCHLPIDHC
jgi:hypothetical protein